MRAVFRWTLRVIAVTAKKDQDVDWHSSGRVGAICGFTYLLYWVILTTSLADM